MKTKFWLCCLVFIIPFGLFSQTYEVTVGTKKVCSEDTLLIPVNVKDFTNIGAITLFIGYDTTVLKFAGHVNVHAQTPGVLSNAMVSPKTQIGIVWSASAAPAEIGTGKFLDLKFAYRGGNCNLTFNSGCEIADYDGNVLTTTLVPGNISQGEVPSVNLGSNIQACQGSTVTLDAGAADQYIWSNGATLQKIDVTAAGTFSVTATSTDGCSDTDTIDVTFTASPDVNLGTDTNACVGDVITLDPAVSGLSYQWNNGATTQHILVNADGSYSVTVTFNGCPSGSDTIEAMFHPLPVVSLGQDDTICHTEIKHIVANFGYDHYVWNNGSTNDSLTFNGNAGAGVYTFSVTVTGQYGCTNSDTIVIKVENCSGIEQNDAYSDCLIYPNPGAGLFTLMFDANGMNNANLCIFNMQGQIVYSEELKNLNGKTLRQMNLSAQNKGIYHLRIVTGNRMMNHKIIIQ